jgi:exosortase A
MATRDARTAAAGEFRLPLAKTALIAVLVVLVFHRLFVSLWWLWWENANYSHGFLVPLISAGLVWLRRGELRATAPAPAWRGLLLLAASLGAFLLAVRMDLTIVQGYAFLGSLIGLAVYAGGPAVARRLLFPVAYLLFMLPFPPWFVNRLSFGLKLLAARSSCRISQAAGIPVVEDGLSLYFPTGRMTIENACSGMQSLIALLALGALVAFFARGAAWKRVLLFVLAVPVALFSNIVRITALCFVANFSGMEAATGLFHDVSGFVLFGLAFGLLVGVKKALKC